MVIESGTGLTWGSLLQWHFNLVIDCLGIISWVCHSPVNWGNKTTQLPHPREFFIWLNSLFTLLLFTSSCYLSLNFCNSFLLLDHPVVWQQTVQSSICVILSVCYSTLYSTCHSTSPNALWSSVLLFLLDFLFSACSLRTARTHQNLLFLALTDHILIVSITPIWIDNLKYYNDMIGILG